jgi:hypothetical protein
VTLDGWKASAGQLAPDPVQFSATSQSPADGRHVTLDGWKASAGQLAPDPVQFSATSQSPAEGRHVTLDGWRASPGQVGLDPVQFSATSQTPADDRQTVADDWKASAGQAMLEPVQFSATSHTPAEARHTVLPDWKTSTQVLAVPEQWSAASLSQTPPCEVPVQGVDEEANPFAGHVALLPVQFSATSHCPAEARHTLALVLNVQVDVQQEAVVPLAEPWSHCSGLSTTPSPQSE